MCATFSPESGSIVPRGAFLPRDVNGKMHPCRVKPPMMRRDMAAGYNRCSFTRHSTGQWISR